MKLVGSAQNNATPLGIASQSLSHILGDFRYLSKQNLGNLQAEREREIRELTITKSFDSGE